MSSTAVPQIPKSIPLDLLIMHYEKHRGWRQHCLKVQRILVPWINLLKMHYKKHRGQRQFCLKMQRILVPQINLLKKTYNGNECQAVVASDPKINIIRDRFIENALWETQGPKAALCLKIQRILVPQINLLKDLRQWWMSSTTVPRIPKSIPSGIDLLKMHYEKHEGQRQRCI